MSGKGPNQAPSSLESNASPDNNEMEGRLGQLGNRVDLNGLMEKMNRGLTETVLPWLQGFFGVIQDLDFFKKLKKETRDVKVRVASGESDQEQVGGGGENRDSESDSEKKTGSPSRAQFTSPNIDSVDADESLGEIEKVPRDKVTILGDSSAVNMGRVGYIPKENNFARSSTTALDLLNWINKYRYPNQDIELEDRNLYAEWGEKKYQGLVKSIENSNVIIMNFSGNDAGMGRGAKIKQDIAAIADFFHGINPDAKLVYTTRPAAPYKLASASGKLLTSFKGKLDTVLAAVNDGELLKGRPWMSVTSMEGMRADNGFLREDFVHWHNDEERTAALHVNDVGFREMLNQAQKQGGFEIV